MNCNVTLSRNDVPMLLHQWSIRVDEKIRSTLTNRFFALTTDHWTSIAKSNYQVVTAHYVDDDWELRSIVIDCSAVVGKQTGIVIADSVVTMLNKYNLSTDACSALVTDTAMNTNMNAAANQLTDRGVFNCHYCLAHVLQLTANVALKSECLSECDNAITRARSLVGHFNHGGSQLESLMNDSNNTRKLTVIQDVSTRWWSTLSMISKLLEL